MEIGVGAAQVGLCNAHLVALVAEAHRADVFQFHKLVIEDQARNISLDRKRLGPGQRATHLKSSIHAAVARERGQVEPRLD